jgi:hypothetical protein
MKYIKTFENFDKISDDKELTELFWLIKDNYNENNLEVKDSAMYGYYFIYTIDEHLKIEVGLTSVKKIENEKIETLNVSKSLITEIVSFFETNSKELITPNINNSPGW